MIGFLLIDRSERSEKDEGSSARIPSIGALCPACTKSYCPTCAPSEAVCLEVTPQPETLVPTVRSMGESSRVVSGEASSNRRRVVLEEASPAETSSRGDLASAVPKIGGGANPAVEMTPVASV